MPLFLLDLPDPCNSVLDNETSGINEALGCPRFYHLSERFTETFWVSLFGLVVFRSSSLATEYYKYAYLLNSCVDCLINVGIKIAIRVI
jgi:hypothetical protein